MDAALGRLRLHDRKPVNPKFKARRWLFVLVFSSVELKVDRWQYLKDSQIASSVLKGDQYLTDEVLYQYAEIYHEADRSTVEILYKVMLPRDCPRWLEPPLQELLFLAMSLKLAWLTVQK